MSRIDDMRKIIDECDSLICQAFLKRMEASCAIGLEKRDKGLAIYDKEREKAVIDKLLKGVDGVNQEYVELLWSEIFKISKMRQERIFKDNGV